MKNITRSILFEVPDEDSDLGDFKHENAEILDERNLWSPEPLPPPRRLLVDGSSELPGIIRIPSSDTVLVSPSSLSLSPSTSSLSSYFTTPLKDGPSPFKELDPLISYMGYKNSDFEVRKKLGPSASEERFESQQSDEYHQTKTLQLEKAVEDSLMRLEKLIDAPYIPPSSVSLARLFSRTLSRTNSAVKPVHEF